MQHIFIKHSLLCPQVKLKHNGPNTHSFKNWSGLPVRTPGRASWKIQCWLQVKDRIGTHTYPMVTLSNFSDRFATGWAKRRFRNQGRGKERNQMAAYNTKKYMLLNETSGRKSKKKILTSNSSRNYNSQWTLFTTILKTTIANKNLFYFFLIISWKAETFQGKS